MILASFLQKDQQVYWKTFYIDIVNYLTTSSISLGTYRMNFYDDKHTCMYILNSNADTFIRRGYQGGRADIYIYLMEKGYMFMT